MEWVGGVSCLAKNNLAGKNLAKSGACVRSEGAAVG